MRIPEWRRDLLHDLKNFSNLGEPKITKVIWLTARDENVCSLCAAREGRYFTFEEVKQELKGRFCKPGLGDRCRCCFVVDDLCYE